jgi:hypothetical protein
MKTLKLFSLFFVGILITSLGSCECFRKKNITPNKTAETTDLLKGKTFKAFQIKEGSTIVYKDGATNNIIPGYSQFRLTLDIDSRPVQIVKLVEFTGEKFNGHWELAEYGTGKQMLKLTELTPQPTNTNGTIEFEVKEITATKLLLNSLKDNLKTGGTINEYHLIPE